MARRRFMVVGAIAAVVVLVAACDPERIYTYRIATRGPVGADAGEFAAQVDRTLRDPRGWSLGGSIGFRRTDGPANFTVWLASAGSVPSFSSACSSQWSCRVGPNVIINHDRWRGATATWPYGLRAYRDYVTNHEVGHWLGFGHQGCPAPGLPAPVMTQQSKGGSVLGACRFNTWPTQGELQAAARRHGVSVRPTGLASPEDPFGNIDRVQVERRPDGKPRAVRLAGWAMDGDTTGPLLVAVFVDGRPLTMLVADRQRADLARAVPMLGGAHAFDQRVELPPTASIVCLDAIGAGPGLPAAQLGCPIVK